MKFTLSWLKAHAQSSAIDDPQKGARQTNLPESHAADPEEKTP